MLWQSSEDFDTDGVWIYKGKDEGVSSKSVDYELSEHKRKLVNLQSSPFWLEISSYGGI